MIFVLLLLSLCSCRESHTYQLKDSKDNLITYKGMKIDSIAFTGTEPFWKLILVNDSLKGFVANKEIATEIKIEDKASRGNTLGFKTKNLYGILNESIWNPCELAITEEDTSWEIYFVFDGKTYNGCGRAYTKEGERGL